MVQESPDKDCIKTGNLASGVNHKEYLQFVRGKMYIALDPSKNVDDDVSASSNAGSTTLSSASAMIHVGNNDGAEGARLQVTDITAAKPSRSRAILSYTLMGPIVEDFCMLCHCSDLIMTSTPVF